MRANHDIDTAFAQQFEDFFLLSLRAEAAEHFDSHGVIEHTLPKHLEMLLGQNSGRREDCDLFAIHNRFKRSANGDFGLAKTDITANQTVHRLPTRHIAFRRDDCSQLVWRFEKWKRMLEFRLPSGIRSKCVTRMHLPLRLD